jgi:hypothetical protein
MRIEPAFSAAAAPTNALPELTVTERTSEMPGKTLKLSRTAFAAAALGLLSLQAQAQSSPWYIGVQQRIEHQTNVYQSAGTPVSDTVSTTSLIGGFDQQISRQRFWGQVSLGANKYQDRGVLDHNSHSARVGMDWETAGNLSGSISADSSVTLADFAPVGFTTTVEKNTTSTVGARAVARLGTASRLSFEVGGATRRTRYDNPLFLLRNLNIDEAFAGVRYRPAGALVLGFGLRATRGQYPNLRSPAPGVYTPEGFDRNNIDLTAEWPISGASRVDARISTGRDRYDTLTSRDFTGVTGELAWKWQPTGRSSFVSSFIRRSGDDTSISTIPGQVPYATSINRVSNTVSVAVDYELTGKIKTRASLAAAETDALNLLEKTQSSEFLTTATVGLLWEASRAIRVGCDVANRSRSTRAGVAGYNAAIYGCYGEFVLR